MSQERIEAAAVTLCEQLWENAHERQKEYALEEAAEALAAADAVMFSDEAIERAARAMLDAMYDDKTLRVDDGDRGIIRVVVAALKGDG
ncbi:hypothetical protein PP353_gp48 [Arthrobacter phage Kumotta]|uniref:Uncharacterized protein n=1 Tax=Arthrobacter phage Kumotta TaxID=2588498 RepID=A0A4Y6ELG4_9CAUD|nr:hypothetical protein PP353_gp48 [Arthrobacter phage Kumotta]QDF19558.1 hypothetical protein SEA_KUMOTTA_48 [Arthrobacter phage Kumotta]